MRLEDLKGVHQYDNVYLVGNGDCVDANTLKNPSFATNLINRIYPQTDWRPKYYVCTDTFVLDNYKDEVFENIEACELAFVPVEAMPKYGRRNVVPLIIKHEPSDLPITEGIYSYGTTLFLALQIAEWMKYEEATFVNCDLYFGKQLHFYTKDDVMNKLSVEELGRRRWRSILAHYKMNQYANTHNMKLTYR